MKEGWIIGDFEPSLYRTPLFEIGVKTHVAKSFWPTHYQQVATEYNCLVSGMLYIKETEQTLTSGDLFVIAPQEVITPQFMTDCTVVVVKIPSLPQDKVVV